MATATAISIISFSIAALVSPHWVLPPLATAFLVAGLFLVDLFFRRLLAERDQLQETNARLVRELREAQLDTSDIGLLSKDRFLANVEERMEHLIDGGFLAGIVVRYVGEDAASIGNPYSRLGRTVTSLIVSELRGTDIATLGAENELWMLIEPKRLRDAMAVANRVRGAFVTAAPSLQTQVGVAAYPMTLADAEGLFTAARQHAKGDAAPRFARHLFAVENEQAT